MQPPDYLPVSTHSAGDPGLSMSMDQVVLDAEAGNSVAVKAWLDGGNRVNSQANEQQRTLLMHVNGHVQLAAMLIARGADINLQDKRGDTALMLAATRGDTSMVAYLLENGARTDLQNSDGGTALEMAEWRAYKSRLLPAQNKKLCAEAARLIRQSTCTTAPAKPAPCTLVEKYVRLVKLVNRPELNGTVGFVKSYFEADERYAVALDGGAKVLKLKRENVEECISPRVPPNYIPMSSTLGSIMGAATRGDAAMIETWLNGGGQVNAPFGEHGITLLMRASMYGHQRLVDMLLQRRADVNLQDRTGAATALMHAATQGHESVVSKLLKAGARTDLRSVHGTVLDVANDRSAIRLLLMQHADKAAAETAAAEVAAADKAAAQRAAAEKAAAEKAAAEKAAAAAAKPATAIGSGEGVATSPLVIAATLALFREREDVLYTTADGRRRPAKILKVHVEDVTPHYTILVDGVEKGTERPCLSRPDFSPTSSTTPSPSAIASLPAGTAASPPMAAENAAPKPAEKPVDKEQEKPAAKPAESALDALVRVSHPPAPSPAPGLLPHSASDEQTLDAFRLALRRCLEPCLQQPRGWAACIP